MPQTPPVPPEHLSPADLLAALGLLAWLIAAVWAMVRARAVTRGAFAAAPVRRGRMGLHDVAITAGLFVLGLAMVGMALGPALSHPGASTANQMLRQMLLSQAGMLPAIAYIFWRADTAVAGGIAGLGLRLGELPVSAARAVKALLVLYPVTLGVSAVTFLILVSLGHQPPVIAHRALEELVRKGPDDVAWWGLAFSAVVLAPVLEELIFRGLIQTGLLQSGIVTSRWTAIVCSAVPFTFIHIGAVPPHALPGLYTLAVGLGWAYERWGSLWTPILIHALYNAVNIALASTVDV